MIRNMKDGRMSNREFTRELGISRNTATKLLNQHVDLEQMSQYLLKDGYGKSV